MAPSAFDDKSKEPQATELKNTPGEEAVHAARASSLPDSILTTIDEAPKYAEGRGVRIEVRNKRDLQAVKMLASVKIAN